MGKRIDKVAKAAHIKRNTEGTSNEISFSVLDAAKNSLDGEGSPKPFGTISLFTLSNKKKSISTPAKDEGLALTQKEVARGSARSQHKFERRQRRLQEREAKKALRGSHSSQAPCSLNAEVASRKRARKRGKLILGGVLAIAVIALIGGLAWWGVSAYESQQAYKGGLNGAISELSNTDELLEEIDNLVIEASSGDALSSSLDEVKQVQVEIQQKKLRCFDELDDAEDAVAEVVQNAGSTANGNSGSQALDVVTARRQMLTSGVDVVDTLAEALAAKEEASNAWQLILAADGLAREAAELASKASLDDMRSSTEKSEQAIEAFSKAKTAFENAAKEFPEADFIRYSTYIDKRLEAQGYAIASNEALINRDAQTAMEQNEAYNTAEQQAGELAGKLPDDPIEIISDAFESKTAQSREMYDNARSQAQSADAFMRDYLGASYK